MPRKKQQQLKKEQSLQINNYTKYAGNVEIELYNGGKLVSKGIHHNTGTVAMCNYIATCLTGSYVIAKRPGLCVPCKIKDGKIEDITTFGIPVENTPVIKDGSSYSIFQFVFSIPGSLLVGNVKQIEGLRLYAADHSAVYAELDLRNNPIVVEGLKDANIIVKWNLTISFK